MRDGKELVRFSRRYAEENRWRSWWHLWSTLSVFVLLAVVVCLGDRWFICLPASFLLGLVAVRVFILYHDFEHGTILHKSRLAALVLKSYGLVFLNPPSIWRRSHDHHHRNNAKIFGASIGSYPVMTRERYFGASRKERFVYLLTRHPVTIAFGYVTIFLWGMCARSFLSNPKLHLDSALAIVIHVALFVTLAIFSPWLLLFLLIIPILVACGLGAYLFYAQHNFPGVELQAREDWDYVFAALRSSSFIRMGPLLRWFTGDIGFHHVHHLNARIPFYRLAEAMKGIEELQSPKTTSLSVVDVWRCFRLKLWDAEQNRMVPLRDAS